MRQLKIEIYPSFLVASKLFRLFESQITNDEAAEIYLNVFSNCREQGIVLKRISSLKMVLFSENRNCGFIVVYYGIEGQFDITTNLPETDDTWAQSKFFKLDEYEDAAAFIKEWLFSEEAQ